MSTGKVRFETVDAYIATFPADVQAILESIRRAVNQAEPEGEEVISYQLPAVKYRGKNIFYYSAYKDHYSISVPPPFTVFAHFKEELAPYEMTKTAVRFPLDQPVPLELFQKIVQYKVNEIANSSSKKKK